MVTTRKRRINNFLNPGVYRIKDSKCNLLKLPSSPPLVSLEALSEGSWTQWVSKFMMIKLGNILWKNYLDLNVHSNLRKED